MRLRIGDKIVEGEFDKNGVFVVKCNATKDDNGNVNISVPCLQIKKEETNG